MKGQLLAWLQNVFLGQIVPAANLIGCDIELTTDPPEGVATTNPINQLFRWPGDPCRPLARNLLLSTLGDSQNLPRTQQIAPAEPVPDAQLLLRDTETLRNLPQAVAGTHRIKLTTAAQVIIGHLIDRQPGKSFTQGKNQVRPDPQCARVLDIVETDDILNLNALFSGQGA